MFFRKLYLTLYHFRWTALCLVVFGAVAVYYELNTLGTFILTILISWLQPFLDKMKEVGQRLELESPPVKEPPESVALYPDSVSPPLEIVAGTRQKSIERYGLAAIAKKPVIVATVIVLLSLVLAYLYFYLTFWP